MISFNSDHLHWQPGDVLVVRPQNSDAQVDELFDIFKEHDFNFGPNTIVKLNEIDAGKKKSRFFSIFLTIEILF